MNREGLHKSNGLNKFQTLPQTLLDESIFFNQYRPIEADFSCGLVIDNKDYLFSEYAKLVKTTPVEHVWSLLEDDLGEAYILGGRICNAIGFVITEMPRLYFEQIKVEFDGL